MKLARFSGHEVGKQRKRDARHENDAAGSIVHEARD